MSAHRLLFPLRQGCRIHGPDCQTPWGYDRAHTDSARPYTLDELAGRDDGPHFYAYPDGEAYERAWALWRAFVRDSRLTGPEMDAVVSVQLDLAERRGKISAGDAVMVREAYLGLGRE